MCKCSTRNYGAAGLGSEIGLKTKRKGTFYAIDYQVKIIVQTFWLEFGISK